MSPPNATRICTDEAAKRLEFSRDTLDRMLADAPWDLPGTPVDIGALGSKKHRWMWDPARLTEWFEAYGRWRASRRAPHPRPTIRQGKLHRPSAKPASPDAPRGKLTIAEVNSPRRGR